MTDKNKNQEPILDDADVKHLRKEKRRQKQKYEDELDLDYLEEELDEATLNMVKHVMKK